jgi:hypothetical protein
MDDSSTAGDRGRRGATLAPRGGRGALRGWRGGILATVAAAGLLAACASGGVASVEVGTPAPDAGEAPAEGPSPAVETPTVPPSPEQMATMLLAPDELKGAWEAVPPTEGEASDDGGYEPCFAAAEAAFASSPAVASAEHMQGTDRSVFQEVVWLGPGAADQFDEIVRGLDQCRDMSFVTPLGRVDGAMGPLSFDLFGDEAEAYRLLYTDLLDTLTYDIAVVRVDEVITMIWRGELAPVPSSEAELERLAAAAVAKITRVGTSGLATA